jgi:hypothetical protein
VEALNPFYKVVLDERFADSAAFAHELRRRGADLHAIRGDITDFWYRDLSAVWQKTRVAVAGMTAHGPLFCLEQLARDYRMRVIFRAEHHFRPDACIHHALWGPDAVLRHAASLEGAGVDWSTHVARMVSVCSTGRPKTTVAIVTAAARSSAPEQDPLFSWVIAPGLQV